jgi:hypothetical protein
MAESIAIPTDTGTARNKQVSTMTASLSLNMERQCFSAGYVPPPL